MPNVAPPSSRLRESGWLVTERSGEAQSPLAKHLPSVPPLHQLAERRHDRVSTQHARSARARQRRAFHERRVEAIRAALAAIEWPDDELSVFATLRGPFFAVGDEALLEWTHRFGLATPQGFRRAHLHPFRVPAAFDGDVLEELAHLRPIADALMLLKRLHRRRNYVPVSETLHELLGATRAHVGFALRTGRAGARQRFHVAEPRASSDRPRQPFASWTSCAWPPRTPWRQRRRFSKRTATASG
jgi:hypothetical protein